MSYRKIKCRKLNRICQIFKNLIFLLSLDFDYSQKTDLLDCFLPLLAEIHTAWHLLHLHWPPEHFNTRVQQLTVSTPCKYLMSHSSTLPLIAICWRTNEFLLPLLCASSHFHPNSQIKYSCQRGKCLTRCCYLRNQSGN